ncbi:hypothetical protein BBJ28_00011815 [Nothophytophthora sp. Chile5]|nr:hypothetical protein BBJ28_00011815 [Nothophytophthora sp. Chile5]
MGSPSVCDECGKKFKVFGSKKKCKHCMDVMCKTCYPAHLELKHTHVGRPMRSGRRRVSLEVFDATGSSEQDLQFLSPVGTPDLELEYGDSPSPDVLDGMEDVEPVSDEDDDDDDDVDDYDVDELDREDADDDDDTMASLGRRPSIEEEETQYREFQLIQGAVATWAFKEKQAKQRLQRRLDDSYRSVSPVLPDAWRECEYQECGVFAVGYAVAATLAVWAFFALAFVAFLYVRRALALPQMHLL